MYEVLKYLKANVGERVGVYAQGPVASYIVLLLNIF